MTLRTRTRGERRCCEDNDSDDDKRVECAESALTGGNNDDVRSKRVGGGGGGGGEGEKNDGRVWCGRHYCSQYATVPLLGRSYLTAVFF